MIGNVIVDVRWESVVLEIVDAYKVIAGGEHGAMVSLMSEFDPRSVVVVAPRRYILRLSSVFY